MASWEGDKRKMKAEKTRRERRKRWKNNGKENILIEIERDDQYGCYISTHYTYLHWASILHELHSRLHFIEKNDGNETNEVTEVRLLG